MTEVPAEHFERPVDGWIDLVSSVGGNIEASCLNCLEQALQKVAKHSFGAIRVSM